jgi:urease accessory protein
MNAALLMLVDGRFPAGGHTNSAGVEAAVRCGDVRDDVTLERYLLGRLSTTGSVDAAFAARAAALTHHDHPALLPILDIEYTARVPSPRLRSASRRLGRQLQRAARPIWSGPVLDAVDAEAHQPIVLGAVVAAAGGTPHDAALVVFHHLGAAVTSAAIRLLGLDPMAVAGVQARVGRAADDWAAQSVGWASCPPAELPANGGSLTDILAEDHGRWDARLFFA